LRQRIKRKIENVLDSYPKVFFCHVPKCGGVSLSDAIYESLYPKILKASRFTSNIDLKGSRVASEILNLDMMTVREAQLVNYLNSKGQVFVTGHCRARPEVTSNFANKWNFITVLRKPEKRFVSEYIYNRYKSSSWLKNDSDILEYLDTEKAKSSCTTYARFFSKFSAPEEILAHKDEAIDSAIENIENFASVGVLEHLDSWKKQFNNKFGVNIKVSSKNTTPNNEQAQEIYNNNAVMDRIHELTEIDRTIYEAVLDKNLSVN